MAVERQYLINAIKTRLGDFSLELILDKRSLSHMTRLKLANPNQVAQIEKMEADLNQRIKMSEGTIAYLTEVLEKVEKGEKDIEGVEVK
jgi:hypothetical protein